MWTRWHARRAAPSHEDFKPLHDWRREESDDDILLVNLPGFKKEQLRVQLDNCGNMKISGELPTDGNKRSRFLMEFHVPEGCKLHEIRARFENGILSVTMPKTTNRVKGVQDQQPAALVEAVKSDSKTNGGQVAAAAPWKIDEPLDAGDMTTKEPAPMGCNLHDICAKSEYGLLSATMPEMTNRVEGVQGQQPPALVREFKSDGKTNASQVATAVSMKTDEPLDAGDMTKEISGELPTDGNKRSRFLMEFHVPEGCKLHEIRARFENGILSETMPAAVIADAPRKTYHEPAVIADAPRKTYHEPAVIDDAPRKTHHEPVIADAPRKTYHEPPDAGDMTKENNLVVKIDRPMDGGPSSYRCKSESCKCCVQTSNHGFKKMSMAVGQSSCCCCTSEDCKCYMGISISGLSKLKKMPIDVGPSSSYCKSDFYICGMGTSPYGLNNNPMKIAASVLVASMLVALGSYGAYKVRS